MTLRTSLHRLIGRDPARLSLRERAAATAARVEAFKPDAPAAASITPAHAKQVAQAGLTGDVLAASGIDHRDGTVSYTDATGKVSRRPTAHWIAFNALQMHTRVQGEMARRRTIEAGDLSAEQHAAWEARIRYELRSDAIHALTFQHVRTFEAAQALRTGAEPATQELRKQGDAELVALASEWQAARDAYAEAIQRQLAVSDSADSIELPPSRDRPHEDWLRLVQGWRERTGVDDAEAASAKTLDVLAEIEDRIADLSAASLAGLRLKVLVAQRCDDIDVEWPDELGTGLIRDLLAFTAPPEVDWHAPPPGFMASPAIEPVNFAWIPQGLRIELDRLHDIAEAEFRRRISALRETGNDTPERAAAIRASLHLPALTAAIDLGSVEAATLAALVRPAGPDPVLALIAEHRAAYAEWDRTADVWSEMLSSDPGYAEAMAASKEPGKREVAAHEALFAAQPATLPGVLALAEYLHESGSRVRIDIEPSEGERGLATVVDALRAVLATREEKARRETSLVGMLDLASATMSELQAIRDVADAVGGVAYAYTWGPRCGERKGRHGTIEPNELGKLMHWLGDALTEIESSAELEVWRRAPGNRSDRETRLSMCAATTIDGGDPAAIEALARELLAHVQAEHEDR